MKVVLVTNFEGLMAYKQGYAVFEAAGKYAGKSRDFVHEIIVDVEEVQTKAQAVGHVIVQRKIEN